MSQESDGSARGVTIFIVGSFVIWVVFLIALNEADSISETLGFLLLAFGAWALLIWSISSKSKE